MSTDLASAGGDATDDPAVKLELTVVRYSDGPDRCTIYPPEATGDDRLTRWYSVDADAIVDLASVR